MIDHDDDEIVYISKSQQKREAEALQAMGERLVDLPKNDLAKIPLEPQLAEAIALAIKIRNKHQAFRRQVHYIGKVMRNIDTAPIAEALAKLDQTHQAQNYILHSLENWRTQLLTGDNDVLTTLLTRYPHLDSQHIRTLVRQATSGADAQRIKASRELFRYLRSELENVLADEAP